MSEVIDALLPLGFTDLESSVYVFLLQSGPATGYRVSQGTGKPIANTYKALATLQAKGAVWPEEGGASRFRAVPARELLARIQHDFTGRRKRAADALAGLARPEPPDEQIYRLSTPAQVYDRCRAILRKAKRIALIDVFPLPLAELRGDIAACARRGVSVGVQVYEPADIARAEVAVNFRADAVRARWKDQWVNIVADSAEYVVALLAADGAAVKHATWSTNAFLAHTFLSGLAAEIFASELHDAVARNAGRAELLRIAARHKKIVAAKRSRT
jgi:HTH-type transcriptional regulator, sugar sensing transcriptional regulator